MAGMALVAGLCAQALGAAANAATSHPKKAINLLTYTGKDRAARLKKLANAEGHLVIYSTTGDGLTGLISAFNLVYPNIKVSYIQGPPATILGPIETADAAGQYNWDVVMLTQVYELLFRQIGAIAPFYSPEAKNFTSNQNTNGPNGTVWALAQSQLESGIAYNKTLIPNPPKTVNDLLKPEYAGKMAVPNNASTQQMIGSILSHFGNKKGLAYLAKLGPSVKLNGTSGTALVSLVQVGQLGMDLDAQYSFVAPAIAAGGSPLGFLKILTCANINQTMISAHAPNLGAALLWADFASSKVGAQSVRAQNVVPVSVQLKAPVSAGGIFYPAKIKKLTSYKFDQLSNLWQTYLTQVFR